MPLSMRKRELVTAARPKSAASEAYRSLRTNLDVPIRSGGLQTILLTSALPGEGKSVTSANVAVAYAQANRSVLLIDANMRTPAQHRIFGLPNHSGLSTVLEGLCELDEAVRTTSVGNLKVVCSGPVPPNPSELLDSPAMTLLLQAAKESFDVVIVDAPAIKPVADALVLAGKCDGVVLVLRAGRVKREAALKAKASLAYGNANILGAVLNHAGG